MCVLRFGQLSVTHLDANFILSVKYSHNLRLGWNGKVDGQIIYLTENLISMNLLQTPVLI